MISRQRILVAEDDHTDVLLLKRTFAKVAIPIRLHFVRDGQEAVDYLSGAAGFEDREQHPLPSLFLSDLKMPRLDGFQVLDWLRRQPGLRRIPMIILSSSSEPRDVNRAYDLGANSYLVKPHSAERLSELVQQLRIYWLESNCFPDFVPAKGLVRI
jgi:CheY-like chemotaxis protein